MKREELKPGTVIAERYVIAEKIGAGGMATVYLAEDSQTETKVAMKVAKARKKNQEKLFQRFEHEVKTLQRIKHPSVVKILDCGKTPNDSVFFTMVYLPYPDLDKVVADKGAFSEESVVSFVEQMTSAFDEYHPNGIVHRDIKPSNVIFDDEGRFVLTDFGLARDLSQSNVTATGTMIGTPYYMSPEVLTGDDADKRSDIYQLGIVVYELLTTELPFSGNKLQDILRQVLHSEPNSVATKVKSLSPYWDMFIGKCLAKNPNARYQSGQEARESLLSLASGKAGKENILFGATCDSVEQEGVENEITSPPPKRPAALRPLEATREEDASIFPMALVGGLLLFVLCFIAYSAFQRDSSQVQMSKKKASFKCSMSELRVEKEKLGWKLKWVLQPKVPAKVAVDCGLDGKYSVEAIAGQDGRFSAHLPYVPPDTKEVLVHAKSDDGSKEFSVADVLLPKVRRLPR